MSIMLQSLCVISICARKLNAAFSHLYSLPDIQSCSHFQSSHKLLRTIEWNVPTYL